ncbi:ricin-type beta-trefoil lectin domain protein [uncultured Pelagimonas sp.]|uniref:ricin-type beta-trefoil lectin domain protein n=1 Tax=uncultured Pelagimonas sp. TaxID=1618102 RepID=UPI002612141F|nr:ricin-type beta-trefoil lectin domain protein [uncultured Pelagimonas sp.]
MKNRLFSAVLTASVLTAFVAQAEPVEIYLTDALDNIQNGYCLDIGGAKGRDANPEKGLQGHTCYSALGALGVDQIFETDKFADGILYMPEFDVCAEVASVAAGTSIDLSACNGSEAQSFVFSGEGAITPASATDMCLTVAEATRFGRSKENQIKNLSLEPCDDAQAAYQNWATRSE